MNPWHAFLRKHGGTGHSMSRLSDMYARRKPAAKRRRAGPAAPARRGRPVPGRKAAPKKKVAPKKKAAPKKKVAPKKKTTPKKAPPAKRRAAVHRRGAAPAKKRAAPAADKKASPKRKSPTPSRSGGGGAGGVWCEVGQQDLLELMLAFGLKKSSLTKSDLASSSDPNRLCKALEVLLPMPLTKKYNLIRKLGQGSFGAVLECARKTTGARCAVKLQLSDRPADMRREVAMQKKMHSKKLAPAVIETASTGTGTPSRAAMKALQKRLHTDHMPDLKGMRLYITVMGRVDGTIGSLLRGERERDAKGEIVRDARGKTVRAAMSTARLNRILLAVLQMVDVMKKSKVTHGDMHMENLAYVRNADGTLTAKMIDTGFTTDRAHEPKYDLLQFYRCLHRRYDEHLIQANLDVMRKNLRAIAYSRYGFVLPKSQAKTELLFDKMTRQYRGKYT